MSTDIPTRTVRRPAANAKKLRGDLCVVGSGAAGLSAALEAARTGLDVILLEAAPSLGGQAVHSIIGTFCGLYSNGPDVRQLTYGIANDMLRDLRASGAARDRPARNSIIVQYDEIALARWIDRAVRDAGITALLGCIVRDVAMEGRRLTAISAATRFGDVEIEAEGFIDASGDATLAWHAGLPVQEPETEIYGTQVVLIEGFDEDAAAALDRWEVQDRLADKAASYGLVRKDGFVFAFPGHGTALANMTHVATPMDAVAFTDTVLDGREQADRLLDFLRREYPDAYGDARIRIYAHPGIRQTRWITGAQRLTVDHVRGGADFSDAVARCSWPIELHHSAEDAYWEELGDGHVYTVPYGSLVHRDADNLAAAGRCIDGDVAALSSVRVMGPCIATGAAAAHALALAGSGSLHQIDLDALRIRIGDNLSRNDRHV